MHWASTATSTSSTSGAGAGNASFPATPRRTRRRVGPPRPRTARRRACAVPTGGLDIDWRVADAERLPYRDDSFDVVTSCVGVMFAPHHAQAADELVRVCRPDGRIGLINWTPAGFIGELFTTMKPFAPAPPPGASAPPLWGSPSHVRELFRSRRRRQRYHRAIARGPLRHRGGSFATSSRRPMGRRSLPIATSPTTTSASHISTGPSPSWRSAISPAGSWNGNTCWS